MAVTGRLCRGPRGSSRGDALFESVGSLTGSPWIYAMVALSVLLDVFLPVLPSGVLVIAAATAAAAGTGAAADAVPVPHEVPSILALIACAATASVLGDLVAYRLAWRGGARLDRAISRSRRLTTAQERLGLALARGGGALVILARFAPMRPLGGLPRRRRRPPPSPRLPPLVGPGGPVLGGVQRGSGVLRGAVAGSDLAGDGGVVDRAVRGGGGGGVRDATPARGGRRGERPLGAESLRVGRAGSSQVGRAASLLIGGARPSFRGAASLRIRGTRSFSGARLR